MVRDADESRAAQADASSVTRAVQTPVRRGGRKGFLPFRTNTFDRFFISMVCFVAISLLWMRFVEAYLPLYFALIISVVLGYIIISRG
jgi:predicted small integral membrane protein